MKNRCTLLAIILITCTTVSSLYSQTQIGEDIDGEAAFNSSGRSVSLSSDGNRVAIGAPYNNGNGLKSGHVRIYDWIGNSWIQAGEDIEGEAEYDQTGNSVSLSSDGSRVAIGALVDATGIGRVRIYDWDGNSWIQTGEDIEGEESNDECGHQISLSSDGRRVAIGAPNNHGNGDYSGHARIFEWSGKSWLQVGDDIDGAEAYNSAGSSVSLSSDGKRIAIGALGDDGNGNFSGHIQVYEWNESSWVQVGEDIDGEEAEDRSGYSVSLASNGNRVAIGAPWNDANGLSSGHVRVYDWNGSNWLQVGDDIDGEDASDYSGYSLSLSSDGSRVAIGAPGNSSGAGHVRLYEWNGNSWLQVGQDIDGAAVESGSGWSVALSPDGSRVAVGAPFDNENGSESGHVRIYEFEPVSSLIPVENNRIEIYPNPTSGKIELLGVENGMIKIIDNLGRIMCDTEQIDAGIDISDCAPGIYLVQIILDDQMVTKIIIKE